MAELRIVREGTAQLLQNATVTDFRRELTLRHSAGNRVYAAAAMSELKRNECPNWSEYPSGYARCSFAGFFIGDLYRFPIELEAPANGCGFLRPLK